MKALRCRECGQEYPLEARHVCEFDFGPLEVVYDYAAIKFGYGQLVDTYADDSNLRGRVEKAALSQYMAKFGSVYLYLLYDMLESCKQAVRSLPVPDDQKLAAVKRGKAHRACAMEFMSVLLAWYQAT